MLETVGVVRERRLKTGLFICNAQKQNLTYKLYKIENKKHLKKDGLISKSRGQTYEHYASYA